MNALSQNYRLDLKQPYGVLARQTVARPACESGAPLTGTASGMIIPLSVPQWRCRPY
jgi:hypothetical protein